eukprot:8061625-Pyramimonas_sp.AAC.1
MFRACVFSAAAQATFAKLTYLEDEDWDILAVRRFPSWLQNSMCVTCLRNFRCLTAIPRFHDEYNEDTQHLQAKVTRFLRFRDLMPCSRLLVPRIRYFDPQAPDWITNRVFLNLRIANRLLAPSTAVAYLKSICNAWPTTKRYRQACRPCRCCEVEGGDSIRHMFECPVLIPALSRVLPVLPASFSSCSALVRLFISDVSQMTQDQMLASLLVHDLAFATFNALRHLGRQGPDVIPNLVNARARVLSKRSRRCRDLFMAR